MSLTASSMKNILGFHLKYLSSLLGFNESRMYRKILVKIFNVNFHENPSGGSRFPCGQADGRTD
jgi:hypothetical protein